MPSDAWKIFSGLNHLGIAVLTERVERVTAFRCCNHSAAGHDYFTLQVERFVECRFTPNKPDPNYKTAQQIIEG